MLRERLASRNLAENDIDRFIDEVLEDVNYFISKMTPEEARNFIQKAQIKKRVGDLTGNLTIMKMRTLKRYAKLLTKEIMTSQEFNKVVSLLPSPHPASTYFTVSSFLQEIKVLKPEVARLEDQLKKSKVVEKRSKDDEEKRVSDLVEKNNTLSHEIKVLKDEVVRLEYKLKRSKVTQKSSNDDEEKRVSYLVEENNSLSQEIKALKDEVARLEDDLKRSKVAQKSSNDDEEMRVSDLVE
ncbi:myosin-2-like [Cryptomeria japonica]|uniref:myosin-2-like n=1 Tax=Cryptomeria japonica TaxID=3369 RepID=UPI0027DA55FB|nr:myosin-2-like [Cryptomeria japonica]